MNKNALCVETGIPLLAHPKHTHSKIGGLTDSDSEYSSNSEDELDDLIQYSKQVESNSPKNSRSDQDSLPNLVIYATPQGRTVRLRKTQDPNTSGSQPTDLPYQQSTPLDPSYQQSMLGATRAMSSSQGERNARKSRLTAFLPTTASHQRIPHPSRSTSWQPSVHRTKENCPRGETGSIKYYYASASSTQRALT